MVSSGQGVLQVSVIDERFIFVNCRVEDIPRISDFGLDMLDVAAIELSMEDDNYAFLDDGIPLFDVIIGDPRQNIRFGETENHLMDNAATARWIRCTNSSP